MFLIGSLYDTDSSNNQGFFVMVRAGTAYRHLFSQVKKKIISKVYY